VNSAFQADAAMRELKELHEWVERQRRNLRRIAELGAKAQGAELDTREEQLFTDDEPRKVKITRKD
jgi:hypothetical protein